MQKRGVGLVGAGRTRDGLGPFLAAHFEAAGVLVVAVCGSTPARGGELARQYAERLGHAVAAAADAAAVAGSGAAMLAIASPPQHHLEALQQALAAGLPTLCEKPLVTPAATAAARELVVAFAARGLLLAENCQWPFVLPAFERLFPGVAAGARCVRLRLSPSHAGPAMLADSLSHLLSVLQALWPLRGGELRAVRCTPLAGAEQATLQLDLQLPSGAVTAELQLVRCERQPRPAWLEIDGRCMQRRIGEHYRIDFVDAADPARAVEAADPLQLLVRQFVVAAQGGDAGLRQRLAAEIAWRLDAYAAVLAGCA